MTSVPLYIVATMSEATVTLRRLAREGWATREGFVLLDQRWDLSAARMVCFGRVCDQETAELLLLAAARGAGIVAAIDHTTDLGRAIMADLGRIGTVTINPDKTVKNHEVIRSGLSLLPEQCALLDRLAAGETIASAAAAEYLSLRTANRRIADARETLGVRTTREAVLAYLRLRRER